MNALFNSITNQPINPKLTTKEPPMSDLQFLGHITKNDIKADKDGNLSLHLGIKIPLKTPDLIGSSGKVSPLMRDTIQITIVPQQGELDLEE